MNINKAVKRDRKRDKRRHGMVVDGASTRNMPEIQSKRDEKKKRKQKKESI